MLEARNITVTYGERRALTGVSLRLKAGTVTAIVGPNGAGKSSLLRAFNGTIRPAHGEIILDELPLRSYSRRAVSRRIATVAQEAELRFPVTVMEFVLGGRYARASAGAWGWESQHDLKVAQEVLRETELETLSGRIMNQLSGGERQRAVLARALATEANILLLDEPTANLDLGHQATILALVRARCDQRGASAAVITHDINLAAQFADSVLLLKNGQPLALGAPSQVLTESMIGAAFGVRVLVDAHPLTGVPRVTPVHELRRSL